MWFEILPSFGIVMGALAVPGVACYYINKLCLGNPFKRNLDSFESQHVYRRDYRLTGNPYIQAGLDSIPDE